MTSPRTNLSIKLFRRQGLVACKSLFIGILAFCLIGAERGDVQEYELKAAYLLSLPKHITWPDSVFTDTDAEVVIGVMGKDPIQEVLRKAVEGRTRQGRKITVRKISTDATAEELRACHILYVSESQKGKLDKILAMLASAPILTVSDFDGFAKDGGIIGLVRKGARIEIRANLGAASNQNLDISGKFLMRATVVKTR